MRKDVVGKENPARGLASDLDRVVLAILEGIARVGELDARITAQVVTPPAARAVHIERVRVGVVPGAMIATAFQHQVVLRDVATGITGSCDRVPVQVERILEEVPPGTVVRLDTVPLRMP